MTDAGTQLENPSTQTSGIDTQMAHSEELTRKPGELVRLSISSHSWAFQMKQELENAGFRPGDKGDFDVLWDEEGPMLVLGRVDDDEPAPPGLEDRRRTISERTSTLMVKPPKSIIEGEPETEAGLGLDMDDYDTDNPLYFEPLVQEGTVGLIPVAYEDGTPYGADESEDATSDADSTERAVPEREMVGAVPADHIEAAAEASGVDAGDVKAAVSELAHRISTVDIESAAKYEDLEAGPVRVRFVESREADRVLEAAGLTDMVDASVLEAVVMAHVKAAEELVREHAAGQYAWFSDQYRAFVVSEGDHRV